MNKKITAILIFTTLYILPLTFAESPEIISIGNTNENTDLSGNCILSSERFTGIDVITIPKAIPYSNERFNLYIKNKFEGHITIEDKVVTSLDCNEASDPTYKIYIKDLSTIDDISKSESLIKAINKKINNGEIKIEGTSTARKIKNMIVMLGLKIVSLFA